MKCIASAPATIANLGPGFDIIGVALEKPRDLIEVKISEYSKVKIEAIDGIGSEEIPTDPRKNSATVAIMKALEITGVRKGVCVRIRKRVPIGVGLGSSGASAAAAVFAVNKLLDLNLATDDLIYCAAKGEEAIAGSPHADNVAPSLLGGACVIVSYEPLKVIKLNVPRLTAIVVTPNLKLGVKEKTKKAREILPRYVPLPDVVRQTSALAQLLLGLVRGDLRLIGKGVSGDIIVEPARKGFIPYFDEVKREAIKAGAYGCTISGAGPSLFALADKNNALKIAEKMAEVFESKNIRASYIITELSEIGARVELNPL